MNLQPIADVVEGESFRVCIDLIGVPASTLGCPLTVDLSVTDNEKTG